MLQEFIETHRTVKRRRRLKGDPTNSTEAAIKKSGVKGNAYRHTKTGYRPDIDIIARSSWEANLARVLWIHGIKFEFEPEIFTYPIKRGVKGYVPDFRIGHPKSKDWAWIEVKGWLDARSKTKIRRFKKYYPDDFARLIMVVSKSSTDAKDFCETLGIPVIYYEDLRTSFKAILGTHWEGK